MARASIDHELAAVQMADARDEVTKNYKGVAALTAQHATIFRDELVSAASQLG